jgi:hypothetical protein
LWKSLVDHRKTKQQCPCFHLWSVSPNIAHSWHSCRHPHRHEEASHRCL